MPKITEGRFALGGLTFIAVWLLVVLPLLYRPAQYAPQVHAEQQAHSTLKGEESAKGSPPRSAQANEENGGKHPEQGENEGTEFWPPFFGVRLKITDSLLAGFTFGLLIFTGLLWRSTDKLWTAGERQLKLLAETSATQSRDAERALIAGQRAWINVDISINGELAFQSNGDVRVPLLFTLRNIGRSPATNVRINPLLFLQGPRHTDPGVEHRAYCDIVRRRLDTMLSYTLFPDEEPKRIAHFETISSAQIEELKESWMGAGGDEWKHFIPYIVGCVSYSIPFDDRQHQTGFMAQLKRRLGNQPPALAWGMFNTDERTVPVAEMRLFYSPYGSPHID